MKGFTTKVLHTHYKPNKEDGAIIPPIHLTTTFESGNTGKYDYSENSQPDESYIGNKL